MLIVPILLRALSVFVDLVLKEEVCRGISNYLFFNVFVEKTAVVILPAF